MNITVRKRKSKENLLGKYNGSFLLHIILEELKQAPTVSLSNTSFLLIIIAYSQFLEKE